MAERDLYAILGIPRTASPEDVKKAYRRLAKKHHPDVNAGDKKSAERFQEVAAAHEVLSDPKRRRLYDEFGADSLRSGFDPAQAEQYRRWRRQGGGPGPDLGGFGRGAPAGDGGGFDFASIFEQIFGGGAAGPAGSGGHPGRGRRAPARGEDARATLEIDLGEAVRGCERDVRLQERTLRVKIPAGVGDGQQIRLAGQGAAGEPGAAAGDLLLDVRLRPHPLVRVEGRDLTLDLPITVPEAVNGAEITLPTFEGKVRLRVPPGAPAGLRLRLKGRGLPDAKGGARGDLYAVVKLVLPEPGEGLREAVQPLAALYKGDPREGISL